MQLMRRLRGCDATERYSPIECSVGGRGGLTVQAT